ncbi:MAG TPA: lytic transglycosylase domain-containing protein [Syntrophales bacterium]|nr:lytic transglycosylase domain-containing protein [Syntrophales bacterium]
MDEIFIRILTRTGQYGFVLVLSLYLFIQGLFPQILLVPDFAQYINANKVIHLTNIPEVSSLNFLNDEGLADIRLAAGIKVYDELIAWTAHKYNVDCALVKAVIKTESNFDHKAVSKKGAKGLMQLMPQTASILGVNDCFRPDANIDGGIRHLSYLIDLYKGNIKLALAAYNAGENVVARYRGIPPYADTRAYVRRVLDNYNQYRQEADATTATIK